MLLSGDECGRTQTGNNNAYCQDNEMAWMHWDHDESEQTLLEFTRTLITFRQEHPVLHRREFFSGWISDDSGTKDITWLSPGGAEMTQDAWESADGRAIGLMLNGDAIKERDEKGEPIRGDTLLAVFNAYWEPIPFVIPQSDRRWEVILDTCHTDSSDTKRLLSGGEKFTIHARSVVLLLRVEQ